MNEEITLCNLCTDLVSLRRNETFPLRLLGDNEAGVWVNVRQMCDSAELDVGDVKSELYAAWLPDPTGNADYAVIMFYDDELKWSLAAHYNKQTVAVDAATSRSES